MLTLAILLAAQASPLEVAPRRTAVSSQAQTLINQTQARKQKDVRGVTVFDRSRRGARLNTRLETRLNTRLGR